MLRFRCHTGHAYPAAALAEGNQHALEETLRVALRRREERKNLLLSTASHDGQPWNPQQQQRLADLKRHVKRLREFLLSSSEGYRGAPGPAVA